MIPAECEIGAKVRIRGGKQVGEIIGLDYVSTSKRMIIHARFVVAGTKYDLMFNPYDCVRIYDGDE